MSVELRERKWRGVLEIEKVGVEGCWMVLTIIHGLSVTLRVISPHPNGLMNKTNLYYSYYDFVW